MRRTRRAAAAVALLSLALAAPTAAAAPPELFVRQQTWDTHEQTGAWIPLASAPAFDWLGGYEIGYRLQQDGFQRVALTVAGVPDGQPTQPSAATPYCVGRNGAAGTIEPAGPELQFEGSGAYTVRVSVSPGDGGPAGCLSGESTTASFAVAGLVAPALSGAPRSFRAIPLRAEEFVGVQAPAPPGGHADLHCGRDGTVQPDGSVAGAPVITRVGPELAVIREDTFARPGHWTCVARGTAEGQDDDNDTAVFGTPWSAPITVVVRSDFRRRTGEITRPRARRPRFKLTAEWPAEARGGRVSVTLLRVSGCNGRRYKLRRAGTFSGRFGARHARVRVVRPRRAGFYVGRVAFGGTQLVLTGDDPTPMRLVVRRGRLEYAASSEFPVCPGYRP